MSTETPSTRFGEARDRGGRYLLGQVHEDGGFGGPELGVKFTGQFLPLTPYFCLIYPVILDPAPKDTPLIFQLALEMRMRRTAHCVQSRQIPTAVLFDQAPEDGRSFHVGHASIVRGAKMHLKCAYGEARLMVEFAGRFDQVSEP